MVVYFSLPAAGWLPRKWHRHESWAEKALQLRDRDRDHGARIANAATLASIANYGLRIVQRKVPVVVPRPYRPPRESFSRRVGLWRNWSTTSTETVSGDVSAEYEIDLKDENASAFHAALDYCITHSRWLGGGERRSFRGSIRA